MTTQRVRIISDLLAPFPAQSGGAPEKVITAYLVAVDGIPDMHLGEAARRFLNGMAARNNPAFAPSPTELAIEAKRIWHRNLDLQRAATPSLPPPETAKKSAESIERVRRITMGLVAALAPAGDRPKRTVDLSRDEAMAALRAIDTRDSKLEISPSLMAKLQQQGDEA